MPLSNTNIQFRGSTVTFLTTFTRVNSGTPFTPTSAQISIAFQTPQGQQNVVVPMLPPGAPGGNPTQWYAAWDSRGALPSVVYYSIEAKYTGGAQVTDGSFLLQGNPANLVTF